MIVLPSSAPNDYIVKKVDNKYASGAEHTNLWFPRVTQTNFGYYGYPVFPLKKEKPGEYHITKTHERVLDKWTTQNRAWWIDKPGSNAFFIDDMIRKYSVEVQPVKDARYQHKRKPKKIFR